MIIIANGSPVCKQTYLTGTNVCGYIIEQMCRFFGRHIAKIDGERCDKMKKRLLCGLLLAALGLGGCAPGKEIVPQTGTKENGQAPEDGLLTVTFLDVGQGNAVLVENDGVYMLIDGGDRDDSSYVVSYLQGQGVESLEYVISSHYDADHLNGVVGALHAFPCNLLLDADYTTDTKVYESLLSVIEEKDIAEIHPDMGDTYTFGDAEFTVVCPDAYDYSSDNDNSIGIRLVYGDTSFLICGDADSGMEQVMLMSGLELQSDVYLASHHGSAYSSSAAFLQEVKPQAVVISAGEGNSYGHPAKETLTNIQNAGAKLYRTDVQGEIIVTSDGKELTWNVESTDDFRSGGELSAAGGTDKKENGGTNVQGAGSLETDAAQHAYVLNTNTKKFHRPDCKSAEQTKEQNKAFFEGTRQELIDAGYAPCGNCNP